MNTTTLTRVLFRFMSLWLWWLCLQVIFLTALTRHRIDPAVIASAISATTYLLSGGLVWAMSGRLARWLTGPESVVATPNFPAIAPVRMVQLMLVGCGLVLITLDAVGDIGTYARQVLLAVFASNRDMLSDASIHLVGMLAIVKLLVGIGLIFGSRPMAGRLCRWSQL